MLGWSRSPHFRRWAVAMRDCGYLVSCITYDGDPIDGIDVRILPRLPIGKLAYLWYAPHVRKMARELKPDLVHAHFATSYGLWGAAIKRSAPNTPLIISAWGSDITASIGSPILGALVKRNFAKADHIVAVSHFLAREIMRASFSEKNRVSVIPLGIDFSQLPHLSSRGRSGPVKILFFKHLELLYGPDVLLNAFVLALRKAPTLPMTLTMAGKGSKRESLIQLASGLGIADRVSFPGFIPHEEAMAFIASHDFMCMPTIAPESFGVAALEAAALGLPVIASAVGGVAEIVESGQSGILVPARDVTALADAIITLASNPEMRKSYGAAAARRARERFSWSDSVEKMNSLYQKATSS